MHECNGSGKHIAIIYNSQPCPLCASHTEIDQLRLELAVLALNRDIRDSLVCVAISDDEETIRVTWPKETTGSQPEVRLPKWYTTIQNRTGV